MLLRFLLLHPLLFQLYAEGKFSAEICGHVANVYAVEQHLVFGLCFHFNGDLCILRSFYFEGHAVVEYVQIGNCGSRNGFVYEQSVSLQLCDFLKGFYFIQISSVLKIRFFAFAASS